MRHRPPQDAENLCLAVYHREQLSGGPCPPLYGGHGPPYYDSTGETSVLPILFIFILNYAV
jgi:hypothetical protein